MVYIIVNHSVYIYPHTIVPRQDRITLTKPISGSHVFKLQEMLASARRDRLHPALAALASAIFLTASRILGRAKTWHRHVRWDSPGSEVHGNGNTRGGCHKDVRKGKLQARVACGIYADLSDLMLNSDRHS